MKLSKSLKKRIIRNDIFRCVLYDVWILIWIFGVAFYEEYHTNFAHESFLNDTRKAILYTVIALFGFLLFRVDKLLLDCNRTGKIISVSQKHAYSGKHGEMEGMNTCLKVKYRHFVGRISMPMKDGHTGYYRPGDYIYKIHGIPYPYIKKEDCTICLSCGMVQEKGQKCTGCGEDLPND